VINSLAFRWIDVEDDEHPLRAVVGVRRSNLTGTHPSDEARLPNLRIKEVKVINDELAELLVWAYKQGFLDATQVLTESVKSLDDAKYALSS